MNPYSSLGTSQIDDIVEGRSSSLSIHRAFANHLSEFRKQLPNMRHLEHLRIRMYGEEDQQELSEISFLSHLPSLISLDLLGNISDIQPVTSLKKLEYLDFSSNPIDDLLPLAKMRGLVELRLNDLLDGAVANVLPVLLELPKLQYLGIVNASLQDFSLLTPLVERNVLIDLRGNKFSTFSLKWYERFISDRRGIIELIRNGKNLAVKNQQYEKAADLRDDESKISRYIGQGKLGFSREEYESRQLFFDDLFYQYIVSNPIESPPLEIIKRGRIAIEKYFRDITVEGDSRLFETKLLIVGEGESGKTTLARKLVDREAPMPKKETERTEGIDISAVRVLNHQDPGNDFLIHVWDFGGQEIYHATHQFFLTKRSFYVVINNTRANSTDFNDWLQRISILTDNSPVIIVQNQVANSPVDLDLRGLQAQFSNVLSVFDVDLSNVQDGRFDKLYEALVFHIQQLDHIGSKLPKSWVSIRSELEKLEKNTPYISDDKFFTICKEHGVEEVDTISRLSSFFHDLGVFLHFQDDPILKRLVILQNSWATKGVYMVLDDPAIQRAKGNFNHQMVRKMFAETAFGNMHDEVLSLMGKFELCYRIPFTSDLAYVAPQLLAVEKPAFDWDYTNNLVLYYHFDFMPKGIVSRLMVRLYRFIKNVDQLAWRSGCIFYFETTEAQVVETYGNKKIEIRVKGVNPAKLITIITAELDHLLDSFENLKVKKLIPCNCASCSTSSIPHYFNYDDLMRRKAKGKKKTIECVLSEEDVDYLVLLEGVFGRSSEKDASEKTYIQQIRSAIAKNDIEQALAYLEKVDRDTYLLLSVRYNSMEKSNTLGLSTNEEYYRNITQIGYDIIRFLSSK